MTGHLDSERAREWGQNFPPELHHISNYYGAFRVVAIDIAGRKKNIAHYLAKLPLECQDIFLFKHPASSSKAVAYEPLGDIKDGWTGSDKYSTEQVMFITPYMVMKFSNEYPRTDALKKDHWRIYEIRDNKLYYKTTVRRLPTSFQNKLFHQNNGPWVYNWYTMKQSCTNRNNDVSENR